MVHRNTVVKRIGFLLLAIIASAVVSVVVFVAYTEQLGSLVFALLIGAAGAAVSIARRVESLSEKEAHAIETSWWPLVVPCLVGIAMGGMIYFLFMASILAGDGEKGLFTSNLFPKFTKVESPEGRLLNLKDVLSVRPAGIIDFGKLLVWCFLAGFSERLVPNVLHGIEGSVPNDVE